MNLAIENPFMNEPYEVREEILEAAEGIAAVVDPVAWEYVNSNGWDIEDLRATVWFNYMPSEFVTTLAPKITDARKEWGELESRMIREGGKVFDPAPDYYLRVFSAIYIWAMLPVYRIMCRLPKNVNPDLLPRP